MWKGRAALANQKGEEHGSVTPYQLTTVMVGSIIGVGVLAFPRLIAEQAGTGAPLATLLGAIPPLVAWVAACKLGRWFPKKSPAEYVHELITPWLGWPVILGGILFLVVTTAATVREFGEVLKQAILPNTPIEFNIMLLLLTAAYFVRYDMQVFARVFEVFFPIMILPLTFIALISLKNARLFYVLPIMGEGWLGTLRGAGLATMGYITSMVTVFLLPQLNRPKQALKSGLWGIGMAAGVYWLVVTAVASVFGPEEIKRLVWPTFDLVKTTNIPGFILERLESAFVAIWVAAVFTTVGATYYCALLGIQQLFKLRDHKVFAIPLIPVIYMIAMGPSDIHALYRFITLLGVAGGLLSHLTPVIWVAIGYLRGKGGKGRAASAG